VRRINEALRLKAEGRSIRDIAAAIGAGTTTVYEYLHRAEAAGISWPLGADLDEEAVEARLFPVPSAELRAGRPVPDWRGVHRELKAHRHVTLRLVWLEWRADHPDGWGYSQFCWHYQRWLGVQDVVMRLSYAGGERMFVDFAGDKGQWVDPASGQVHEAEIFVSVLGCSGMLYVEATRGQDLGSWVGAHVHAWEAYGGVAEVTIPDNLRAGVTKACFYEPELNPTYAELARHYGTVVLPTRVARPRDKAAAEAGVLTTERWVLAPLRHRQFFSLGELNAAIREQVAQVNARPFRGEPASRAELFAAPGAASPAAEPLRAGRLEEGDGQY
jgi:transposase